MLEVYDLADLEGKQKINIMMMHQEMGLSWSNTYLKVFKGQKPLYCKPKNLRITGEQAFQIFREEVESAKAIKAINEPTYASGLYLLAGLIKTFPCK